MKKILLILIFGISILDAARIKDIANIQGNTATQVIGYGLVVGLNQTGDNQLNAYTNQSVINMLKRFGLTTDQRNSRLRNVAAVMVTATMPSGLKSGSAVDVVVSSMGDATSLQGGNLLLTPLSRPDGSIVGNAQGPLTVGGYDYRSLGSSTSKNFVTTGRVPNGLVLNTDINSTFVQNQIIKIVLKQPDVTTAFRVAQVINNTGGRNATAVDAATIELNVGNATPAQALQAIAAIEGLNVEADPQAKVVINERTGTVVVGGNVQLLPAVIAHGGLEINIQKQVIVPQPAPFTIKPPRIGEVATVDAKEEEKPATALNVLTPTVAGITDALNLLKVKPRDLIAIFQALKESGSLQAELIVQ
jgi:flagellar P-ring protein precursor FlgI